MKKSIFTIAAIGTILLTPMISTEAAVSCNSQNKNCAITSQCNQSNLTNINAALSKLGIKSDCINSKLSAGCTGNSCIINNKCTTSNGTNCKTGTTNKCSAGNCNTGAVKNTASNTSKNKKTTAKTVKANAKSTSSKTCK